MSDQPAIGASRVDLPISAWARALRAAWPRVARTCLETPWLVVVLITAGTLFLHSRHNEFPYYYEKDAGSKVAQVLSGQRNFFHPVLMLNATELVMRATGQPWTEEATIRVARWLMASFTAVAIGTFSLLASRFSGVAGALCVGVLMATHNLIFDLSHIFKEDPALLMGLALSFWAMQLFWEKRSRPRALWLGVACSVALSGKYVGVAAPLMALVVLFRAQRERTGRIPWGMFTAAFLLTTAMLNYQALVSLSHFTSGLQTELSTLSHEGKQTLLPNWKIVRGTFEEMLPTALTVVMLAGLLDLAVRHRGQPVLWCMALHPVVFTGIMLYSPRIFTRHFLPVFALACFFGGLGICALCTYFQQRLRWPMRGLAIMAPLLILGVVYAKANHQELLVHYASFAHPTREQMIRYLNENLPADAVIAADTKVFLRDFGGRIREDAPVRQRVLVRAQLSKFGSLAKLHQLGVTHVVVANRASGLLFLKRSPVLNTSTDPDAPTGKVPKRFRDRGGFYQEFAAFAELEHAVRPNQVGYVTPGLKLYRLPWDRYRRDYPTPVQMEGPLLAPPPESPSVLSPAAPAAL